MASPSPDATSQPSSILLRNRDNQRASRARRKGYIEDLEKRVRQFERDGAAATVEVQSAARKVADENFWLRHMLSTYGAVKHEVDDYVEGNRMQATSSGQPVQSAKLLPVQRPAPRKRKHSEMSQRELEAARTLGEIDSPKHPVPISPWEVMQSPRVMREQFRDLPTPEDSNGSEQERTASTSPEMRGMPDHQDRYQPPVPALACQEIQSRSQQQIYIYDASNRGKQADVTLCEEAAQIIASMRGHEDPDSVWPELGCSPDSRCTVRNMTIFQLGDMER